MYLHVAGAYWIFLGQQLEGWSSSLGWTSPYCRVGSDWTVAGFMQSRFWVSDYGFGEKRESCACTEKCWQTRGVCGSRSGNGIEPN
jgi:hypothetical protein